MKMLTKIKIRNLRVAYDGQYVLKDLNLDVYEHEILSIIGPANSGKSTFLRVLNRLLDINPTVSIAGDVYIDGKNIYEKGVKVDDLRKRIGMIFALPVPLPMSIFDNLTYGPRLYGERSTKKLLKITEKCLKAASLWDEVKDRLSVSALRLSGGQQQRLCLARALAVEPEIILFDEPCSGLDPISTAKVEATISELKKKYTIILVTNNTKQAARISDRTAFFLLGKLVEVSKTAELFTAPQDLRTNDYVTGRFG